MRDVLWGALGGGGLGLVVGFVVAVLVLQARHWRNARLVARGEPPIKDAILPPFHLPGAVLGLLLGGLLAVWLPLTLAIVVGGTAVPGLLLLLSVGLTVAAS